MNRAKRVVLRRAEVTALRKVTYTLPRTIAGELDARTKDHPRSKSRVVAEALAFSFAAQDRETLAAVYEQAAQDPQFRADNETILRDFEALDLEAAGEPDGESAP